MAHDLFLAAVALGVRSIQRRYCRVALPSESLGFGIGGKEILSGCERDQRAGKRSPETKGELRAVSLSYA